MNELYERYKKLNIDESNILSQKGWLLFLLVQFLWQFVFILLITIWKSIVVFPYFADPSEILEKTRWFWLMDAPHSPVHHAQSIETAIIFFIIAEWLISSIWIIRYFKRNWRCISASSKLICFIIIICAIVIVIEFEMQMHFHFLEMTEYYFLWQRAFPTEVFSIVVMLISMINKLFPRSQEI